MPQRDSRSQSPHLRTNPRWPASVHGFVQDQATAVQLPPNRSDAVGEGRHVFVMHARRDPELANEYEELANAKRRKGVEDLRKSAGLSPEASKVRKRLKVSKS